MSKLLISETTLAHLRLGARQFFNSLLMRVETEDDNDICPSNAPTSPGTSSSPRQRTASPYNTPPGSPAVRDIISDNELQNVVPSNKRPTIICQDCVSRTRNPNGSEDYYGKCTYCDKLVCHLSTCRGCSSEFCKECCIAKYVHNFYRTEKSRILISANQMLINYPALFRSTDMMTH